jgi:MoxR-like ATPase
MTVNIDELTQIIKNANVKYHSLREEICKIIVGQRDMIDRILVSLIADGHVLLEGLPGLAKTLAVNTLAKVIQCDFKRIQFTPDLLPADLIGTTIFNPKEGSFTVSKGPIFTNILLADEINRAPAKVQSALLEVMQERRVTIGVERFNTGRPFMVLATQNPIEHEGTYPLPEAQTDRFMMKIKIDYPTIQEEKEIVHRMATLNSAPEANVIITGEDILETRKIVNQIYIDDKVINYILNLVFATRQPKQFGLNIDKLLLYGASPRASINLIIAAKAHAFLLGRAFVTPHDIKQLGPDILRHRLRRTYEAEAEEISPDEIIKMIFDTIPVP